MRQIVYAVVTVLLTATPSLAHYNMLLPDKPWAEKGEKITFTYRWGHPFEHELSDAPEPRSITVILPDGKSQKVAAVEKTAFKSADGKNAAGFRFTYVPEMRGDHTVLLETPPMWIEESKEFIADSVMVVLHVQTQKNWAAHITEKEAKVKLTPLTRPYGLLPGMIFQAQASYFHRYVDVPSPKWFPNREARIEFERFNPQPVKNPPPDELITFKTTTDPNGVCTISFPQPGWWCVAAHHPFQGEKHTEGNNRGPIRQRATLWLHVDEKR